jgi:Leucine rich repeat
MCSLIFGLNILKAETKEVSCEKLLDIDWAIVTVIKSCFMDKKTSIDSAGTKIATKDDSVKGLIFYDNKNLKCLPEDVAKKFQNLLAYNAGSCALKNLMKTNFEGLKSLKLLYLNGNQIETIEIGTFKDLVDLELVWLSKFCLIFYVQILHSIFTDYNKIQHFNGDAFKSSSKLSEVLLQGNTCIDENFKNPTELESFQQKLSEKCEQDENKPSTQKNEQITTETTLTSIKTNEITTKTSATTIIPETSITAPSNPISLTPTVNRNETVTNSLFSKVGRILVITVLAIVVVLASITAGLYFYLNCGKKNKTNPTTSAVKIGNHPSRQTRMMNSSTDQTTEVQTPTTSTTSTTQRLRKTRPTINTPSIIQTQTSTNPTQMTHKHKQPTGLDDITTDTETKNTLSLPSRKR